MKVINIYSRGICNTDKETKVGKYIALLEYKGNTKVIYGSELYTTSNRMILRGIIESVKSLKQQCNINIYSPTSLGFTKPHKSPNKDLISELKDICNEKGHNFNFIVSYVMQEKLKNLMNDL